MDCITQLTSPIYKAGTEAWEAQAVPVTQPSFQSQMSECANQWKKREKQFLKAGAGENRFQREAIASDWLK
jgi:hypothetical protein